MRMNNLSRYLLYDRFALDPHPGCRKNCRMQMNKKEPGFTELVQTSRFLFNSLQHKSCFSAAHL